MAHGPGAVGGPGAIGDIGSHAENLAHTVTGLKMAQISADLTASLPGCRLDDANVLIRYEGGAKGVPICSQISTGEENGLSLRVYGSEAGLEWRQEDPNTHSLPQARGYALGLVAEGQEARHRPHAAGGYKDRLQPRARREQVPERGCDVVRA